MSQDEILQRLVIMSRRLGDPAHDYVILGEGNTSARSDADTFWVKASGTELRTIGASGFVRVRFDGVLDLLSKERLTDGAVKAALEKAKMDHGVQARPSVETVLHAVVLQLEGVNFVGHTHPTAVNAVTCAAAFEAAAGGRLFPDEIVVCGPAAVVVPYTDPGLPLARAVMGRIAEYVEQWGEAPKTILMQNHGLIALGSSAQQVENITAMAVKAARVMLGTYSAGGPHFLTPGDVDRIHTRPDERYRRERLGSEGQSEANGDTDPGN